MEFCVKCGKKVKTEKGLCSECYEKVHGRLKEFKSINLSICENCNKTFSENRWINFESLEKLIEKKAKKNIKGGKRLVIEADVQNKKIIVKDPINEEEYQRPVRIKYVVCPVCSRVSNEYFEGVLQLRDIPIEIFEWCMNDLDNQREKSIFVTKIDELKNGFDMYITSKRYLNTLGKKLKKQFQGELKITAQLFSRNKQTSKDIYRTTVLFRGNEPPKTKKEQDSEKK